MPGRDNEPPFSGGKCGEALVTSISNLTKSETDETANVGPCSRPDVDGSWDGVLGNRFTLICSLFNMAVSMSEAMTGDPARPAFITRAHEHVSPSPLMLILLRR